MRHLFRTGSLFFVLAGISFLVVALKYLMTDNGSAGSSGALVATGVVWFVVGLAIRKKNST
jgi:hypothetical protein